VDENRAFGAHHCATTLKRNADVIAEIKKSRSPKAAAIAS